MRETQHEYAAGDSAEDQERYYRKARRQELEDAIIEYAPSVSREVVGEHVSGVVDPIERLNDLLNQHRGARRDDDRPEREKIAHKIARAAHGTLYGRGDK